MSTFANPFLTLHHELNQIKTLLLQIQSANEVDYKAKYYTRQEVAEILRCSTQTIDNYIKNGWIEIQDVGKKKKLINHYQIFNDDHSLKELCSNKKA